MADERISDERFKGEMIRMMQTAITKIDGMDSRLTNIETDVAVLKTDVAVLKTDVAVLKTDVAILKTDVAILKTDVTVLKTDVAVLKTESQVNSGKLDDVIFRVIEMYNRLFDIEKQLKSFDEKFVDLEKEHEKIFAELIKLAEKIENTSAAKAELDALNLRVEKLEEKVFA